MDSIPMGPENRVQSYQRDFLASIVVFLVALPLCLGIAIASGVPPAVGLISGIIGGIVVGYFSGAPLQVSGPAAGLVSLVGEMIAAQGIESLGVIVLLAGLMQVSLGLFHLAPLFRAVSPAVIQGMLAGIGVTIFAAQFHVMVDDKPGSKAIENILKLPSAINKGLMPMEGTSHHLAAAIGILSIVLIILWSRMPAKFHIVPPALVAVAVSVLVAAGFHLPIQYVDIPDQFLGSIHFTDLKSLPLLLDGRIWFSACAIAFVATAETMLSTTALDRLHNGVRADYDKEVIAQGVGNTLAGFVGALPITGVIVRSTANIEAGAKTRRSTILHGIWIAALLMLFPTVLDLIPIACLAAVLVYTGYKLIKPKVVMELLAEGKSELAIYLITVIAVVSTNLLEGVLIGFGLSLLKLLSTLAKFKVLVQIDPEDQQIHLFLAGSATFIQLPKLAKTLENLPPGQKVRLHAEQLNYIDHACIELLSNFKKLYLGKGGQFFIEWDALPREVKTAEKMRAYFASSET
jgi:MFS superfamily sulfate permease-like transporter